MRRNIRSLLARLEADSLSGTPAPEREAELEQRNRETVERLEAHPTGRLALAVLDRAMERHGIEEDEDSQEVVRKIIEEGDEAELCALDLIGVIGGGNEPLLGDHETLMRALNDEGSNE